MNRKLKQYLNILNETDPRGLAAYARYQFGLLSGYYRSRTPIKTVDVHAVPDAITSALPELYNPAELARLKTFVLADDSLTAQADRIATGAYLQFGITPAPIDLRPPLTHIHWSQIRDIASDGQDIKFIWDPARFDWALVLARAALRGGGRRYADAFTKQLMLFLQNNPVNGGPNWVSGQEIGLRLINLCAATSLFAAAGVISSETIRLVKQTAALHAARVQRTLAYAVAQNNNHILSEAAALITAGVYCADDTNARLWYDTGQMLFERHIQSQIDDTGEYVQHSTNYHRLMLSLALWANKLLPDGLSADARKKLSLAVDWLQAEFDCNSGQCSNLGHNDGSHLFQLTACGYSDYRPILSAAAHAFQGEALLPEGPWDELTAWLVRTAPQRRPSDQQARPRLDAADGWARLRLANTAARPAHADMMHVDIWHKGIALALDGGTYRYTAQAPWQNPFRSNSHHNSVDLTGRYALQPVERFRWTGKVSALNVEIDVGKSRIIGTQDGLQAAGISHKRTLAAQPDGWLISDELTAMRNVQGNPILQLHWLLADLPWSAEGSDLLLRGPDFVIRVGFSANGEPVQPDGLIRAGEVVAGVCDSPQTFGWFSPTYNVKQPALSVCLNHDLPGTLTWTTRFTITPADTPLG